MKILAQLGRRRFLKSSAAMGMIPALGIHPNIKPQSLPVDQVHTSSYKIKLSCNFYSLNEPLRSGRMSLDKAIEFCAQLGFDAIDLTASYIPGYPQVPKHHVLFDIKKKAFRLGLAISGTGVRNDFTTSDPIERNSNISLVKEWVKAAAQLDAPVLRTFTGHFEGDPESEGEIFELVLEGFKECVAFGADNRVIINLQNHNELLKTADQMLQFRDQVDSE